MDLVQAHLASDQLESCLEVCYFSPTLLLRSLGGASLSFASWSANFMGHMGVLLVKGPCVCCHMGLASIHQLQYGLGAVYFGLLKWNEIKCSGIKGLPSGSMGWSYP
ncbi:hypothetical protein U1Q18_021474 [Sarracenia purpurea var. burkii]